jgi:MFS transporter, DHA2 family, multidrug resistance protein
VRWRGKPPGVSPTGLFFHLAGTRATTTALMTAAGLAALAALVSLSRLTLAPRPRPDPPDQIGRLAAGP